MNPSYPDQLSSTCSDDRRLRKKVCILHTTRLASLPDGSSCQYHISSGDPRDQKPFNSEILFCFRPYLPTCPYNYRTSNFAC